MHKPANEEMVLCWVMARGSVSSGGVTPGWLDAGWCGQSGAWEGGGGVHEV